MCDLENPIIKIMAEKKMQIRIVTYNIYVCRHEESNESRSIKINEHASSHPSHRTPTPILLHKKPLIFSYTSLKSILLFAIS